MFRRLFFPFSRLVGRELILSLQERSTRDRASGIQESITYYIFTRDGLGPVGYVSLRLGESPELYYLGHIGYRVEAAWRGRGYAEQAVRALQPLIQSLGLRSLSITTDTDNLPSRKTCENLGCILENIVPVPPQYAALCMYSPAKCRYILLIPEQGTERTALHEPAG